MDVVWNGMTGSGAGVDIEAPKAAVPSGPTDPRHSEGGGEGQDGAQEGGQTGRQRRVSRVGQRDGQLQESRMSSPVEHS